MAVGNGVGEAGGTVEVGRAPGRDGADGWLHRPTDGAADGGDRQRVMVDVAVVGEQRRGGDRALTAVLGDAGQRVIDGDRGVVDGGDGEAGCSVGGAAMAVGNGVGEAGGTV